MSDDSSPTVNGKDSDETVTAKVIDAGDLEYRCKVFNEKKAPFANEYWKHRCFPRSMLIQFETDEDLRQAIKEKVVYLWIFND